jgi:hypothetical protein
MSTATKTLYDTDFYEWTVHIAELLRERRFEDIDLDHLIEEIEDLGKSDRRAVLSQLGRMMRHLVKARIQLEKAGSSWRTSIVDARRKILLEFEDSPSLRRHAHAALEGIYSAAVKDALVETGLKARAKDLDIPERCPYTLDQLLADDFDLPF